MTQEEFEQAIQTGEPLCDHAMGLYRQGRFEEALHELARAEEVFEQISHEHWLTFIWQEELKYHHALGHSKEVEALTAKVVKGYQRTLNQEGLAKFLTMLAQMYQGEQKEREAINQLRAALAISQKAGLEVVAAMVRASLGQCLMQVEEYLEAIAEFDHALHYYESAEQSMDQFWVFEQLARCFAAIYHPKEAEKFYQVALEGYLKAKEDAIALEVIEEFMEFAEQVGAKAKFSALAKRKKKLLESLA